MRYPPRFAQLPQSTPWFWGGDVALLRYPLTTAEGLCVRDVYNTHMTEVAVSTRISRETKALVEELMQEERLDRSAALRKLLHLGADEYRRRKALEALAAGKASFGEAAEIAGLTLWEFRELVKERKVHWVPGTVVEDIQRGLSGG